MTWDVVVIGSGFAGALLARLLKIQERDVLLVERGSHPRFALGESSTPLAALSLERLARRYGQSDLRSLAAHGRWQRNLATLGCGLKRGFSFYQHTPGVSYLNSEANEARFLVAASPDDETADCQWLRSDVDAHLVERAVAVGVEYRERTEIVAVEETIDGLLLRARRDNCEVDLEARFVVDASGEGEVVARALGLEPVGESVGFSSRLVYAHFKGVTPFWEAAVRDGACLPPGPYPDEWAAVHHMIDEGWIYSLRFDDGRTSVGLLVDGVCGAGGPEDATEDAQATWRAVVGRYPTLRASFAHARPVPPGLRSSARLQRRRCRATGARWAMLPQTFAFFDPLFSTGIAWNLLGVERLAQVVAAPTISADALARYEVLLNVEANQQQALLEAAYLARRDFGVFRDLSFLYFAAVSFEEIRQRLFDERAEEAVWNGFLDASDGEWQGRVQAAQGAVAEVLADGSEQARRGFSVWVADAIRERNLIGLGTGPSHLYGVDLEVLVENSGLLGLTSVEMERLLPRLRGTNSRDV